MATRDLNRSKSAVPEFELRRWMPLWTLPVLIAFATGTVALRLSIVRKTYSIDQADRQIRALKEAREKLEVSVAGLKSPRRLELIARSRFGLSQPRSDQVIYMRSSDGAAPALVMSQSAPSRGATGAPAGRRPDMIPGAPAGRRPDMIQREAKK